MRTHLPALARLLVLLPAGCSAEFSAAPRAADAGAGGSRQGLDAAMAVVGQGGGDPGSGGATGSGGRRGVAGASGAGGANASGGAIGAGGSASGGALGAGGAPGAGGAASAGGSSGGPGGCAPLHGPDMVQLSGPGGVAYCIDRTEVTNGHYQEFLASPASSAAPTAICAWKTTSHVPSVWPATLGADHPVVNVDVCDAQAFCAWAGKKLCGKVGGGPNPYLDFEAMTSQWFYACSSGGLYRYPYGDAFDPSACVGLAYDSTSGFQASTDHPWPPGTAVRCHSPAAAFAAVVDLAGNVAEWEDSCNAENGADDGCHTRGDGYRQGVEITMACHYAPRFDRSYRGGYIGFRCCMDL